MSTESFFLILDNRLCLRYILSTQYVFLFTKPDTRWIPFIHSFLWFVSSTLSLNLYSLLLLLSFDTNLYSFLRIDFYIFFGIYVTMLYLLWYTLKNCYLNLWISFIYKRIILRLVSTVFFFISWTIQLSTSSVTFIFFLVINSSCRLSLSKSRLTIDWKFSCQLRSQNILIKYISFSTLHRSK